MANRSEEKKFSIKILVYTIGQLSSSRSDSSILSNCFDWSIGKLLYGSGNNIGALHSSVLYNDEWEIEYGANGIAKTKYEPGKAVRRPVRSFDYGYTNVEYEELCDFIYKDLKKKFNENTYSLLNNNCHHFCNELMKMILGKEIPDYLKNLSRNTFSFVQFCFGSAAYYAGVTALQAGNPAIGAATLLVAGGNLLWSWKRAKSPEREIDYQ